MIVVQILTVEWSKRSRGMPEAAARNAVPEVWQVQEAGDCALLLNEVRFSEYDGFSKPVLKVERDPEPDALRSFRLDVERIGGGLAVYFGGDPWRPQYPMRKKIATLQVGEWAQIVSNGRKPLEDTWAYAKHVFNIGITSESGAGCFSGAMQSSRYVDVVQL